MKRLLLLVKSTHMRVIGLVLLMGSCAQGLTKSTETTDEAGNAVIQVVVQVGGSFAGKIFKEDGFSAFATGQDDAGETLKFADGTDRYPITMRNAVFQKSGYYHGGESFPKTIMEFRIPAGSTNWAIALEKTRGYDCTMNPASGTLEDLKNSQVKRAEELAKEQAEAEANGETPAEPQEGDEIIREITNDEKPADAIENKDEDSELAKAFKDGSVEETNDGLSPTEGLELLQSDYTIDVTCTRQTRAVSGTITGTKQAVTVKLNDETIEVEAGETTFARDAMEVRTGGGRNWSQYFYYNHDDWKLGKPALLDACGTYSSWMYHVLKNAGEAKVDVTATRADGQECVPTKALFEAWGLCDTHYYWSYDYYVHAGWISEVYGDSAGTVTVDCSDKPKPNYTIAGAVSGQSGAFELSVGETKIEVAADATQYKTPGLKADQAHEVVVSQQPEGQTCTVADAGNVAKLSNDVTGADVTCTDNPVENPEYSLSVSVAGMSGGTLTVRNYGPNMQVTTNGVHMFPEKITANDGYSYDVRIIGSPAGYDCDYDSEETAAGIATADVIVGITCVEN